MVMSNVFFLSFVAAGNVREVTVQPNFNNFLTLTWSLKTTLLRPTMTS